MPSETAIVLRIDGLSKSLAEAKERRDELDKSILRLQGRLDELWDWKKAEETKEKFQLPTFGDREKLEEAIAQRGQSVAGYDFEEAKQARIRRASEDGQAAVDEMDGMPDGDS